MPCVTISVVSPGYIEVTSVSVSPQKSQYTVGETVTVTASCRNPGGTSATASVKLYVNNTYITERSITLAGGQTGSVSFSLTLNTAGNIQICCEV